MIEHCAFFSQALASIRTLDELEGFAAAGRFNDEPLSKDQISEIAQKKIEFQKRQGKE